VAGFHRITFDDIAEAAGLVAALSRQLASPRADLRADLRALDPIEVGVATHGSVTNVYLSTAALTAAQRAFGSPPNAQPIDALPADIVWVLRRGETKFLGRGDVLSLLIAEPSEPLHTRRTARGIVKMWRDDKGYGVIASPDTAPWDIWCSFSAIERHGGVATLPTGESFPVTYDEDGRAFSPTGEQVVSGYITGAGFASLSVGDQVEVTYYRANQNSYRYVARRVRLLA